MRAKSVSLIETATPRRLSSSMFSVSSNTPSLSIRTRFRLESNASDIVPQPAFGDDDVAGGEVVVGVEGFDGELDDGGVAGSGDVDAAGGEDGAVVVVDLDVVQVGRFAAGDEDARAVLGFNGSDAVGIEAAADEADLFSWDGRVWVPAASGRIRSGGRVWRRLPGSGR